MIRKLTSIDAQNLDLVGVLVFHINDNYTRTEKEFWKDGVERVTMKTFQEEICQKNVLVYFDSNVSLGSVNYEINGDEAKFGMLSVNTGQHGKRIGTQLFQAMLDDLRSQKVKKLHLELLVPRHYESNYKNAILEWYLRNGFQPGKRIQTEELDYFPSQNLKIESDFIQMTKKL